MLTIKRLYGITLCVDYLEEKCYNIINDNDYKMILSLQRRENYEELYK